LISIYLLFHGHDIMSLLITFVAVKYGMAIFAFGFTRRLISPNWHFDFAFARSIFPQLKSFSLLSLLSALCSRPELIILSLFANEATVGLYSAAVKLVDFWYLLPQTFMVNVFPVLSRSYAASQESKSSRAIQDRSIKYLMALSLPVAVGISFAAGPILNLLYGPEFVPAAPILQCASWTLPLASLNAVFWRILAARNEQDAIFRVQLISTSIRLACSYALTLLLGAFGAALSAVISLAVHNAILLNRVRQGGTTLRPYRIASRFALGALLMGVVITVTLDRLDFWVVVPVAAATYVGLSFLIRAFSNDDLALMRQVLLSSKGGKHS
jgi:O-antigen/teichoic acid export membrane protein